MMMLHAGTLAAVGLSFALATGAIAQPTTTVTVGGNVAEAKAFSVDDLKPADYGGTPVRNFATKPRRPFKRAC